MLVNQAFLQALDVCFIRVSHLGEVFISKGGTANGNTKKSGASGNLMMLGGPIKECSRISGGIVASPTPTVGISSDSMSVI